MKIRHHHRTLKLILELIVLGLVIWALSACTQNGFTDNQKLNNNPRPFTVVAKAEPYQQNNRHDPCEMTLRARDGRMFVIDNCNFCRTYQVHDTIR